MKGCKYVHPLESLPFAEQFGSISSTICHAALPGCFQSCFVIPSPVHSKKQCLLARYWKSLEQPKKWMMEVFHMLSVCARLPTWERAMQKFEALPGYVRVLLSM